MPRWIINRPQDHSNEGEVEVARALSKLSDRWIVRWGFYYQDNAGQTREGDFLILGPHGGLLVLEVKSGRVRHFASTGNWDTDVANQTDHPLFQLDAEWKATINQFRDQAKPGSPTPFIERALCLTRVDIPTTAPQWEGIPRRHLIARNDLKAFQYAWNQTFLDPKREVTDRERRTFLDLFASNSKPEKVKAFIDHTEHSFRQHLTSQFTLLDTLAANQQLFIAGGAGTGKTWLAIEQAVRYAESTDAGRKVLFLAYNLPLAHYLQQLIARHQPQRGTIVVMAWEELATLVLQAAGLENEAPAESAPQEEKFTYYQSTLPELLLDCVADPALSSQLPHFDALVVDEAQDHDNVWWDIYFSLLTDGTKSPVTLCYDCPQRATFRAQEDFDPALIAENLSQPAFAELPHALRYTRQVHEYLVSLEREGTRELVANMGPARALPEGPEVIHETSSRSNTKDTVEKILSSWKTAGLCQPHEVLILHFHRDLERSALAGVTQLLKQPLAEATHSEPPKNAIRHTNIHRAKGLDATAVIVVGLRHFDQVSNPDFQHTHFMAASRAKQLLAIVQVEE